MFIRRLVVRISTKAAVTPTTEQIRALQAALDEIDLKETITNVIREKLAAHPTLKDLVVVVSQNTVPEREN